MNRAARAAVLVVDDELAVRLIIARMLQDAGYSVRLAASAAAALHLLSTQRQVVDLVVTDIRMPGMNGLDLALEVRRSWPDVPIILISGQLPDELATTHSALVGLAFVRKPFSVGELLQAVDEAAGRVVPAHGLLEGRV